MAEPITDDSLWPTPPTEDVDVAVCDQLGRGVVLMGLLPWLFSWR